jgi:O-methyltransferase involved in polyketide biosynthesis
MGVEHTAYLTAVWRKMGKLDMTSLRDVPFRTKMIGYMMGWLDPASVDTIVQRTIIIDAVLAGLQKEHIVEIGAGLSTRRERFPRSVVYTLDLPSFPIQKENFIPYAIGTDSLEVPFSDAVFVVEGVSMYLEKLQLKKMLKEIVALKGHVVIDFFDKSKGSKYKSYREHLYKQLFSRVSGKDKPFSFAVENAEHARKLLASCGFTEIEELRLPLKKTLDILFYAKC